MQGLLRFQSVKNRRLFFKELLGSNDFHGVHQEPFYSSLRNLLHQARKLCPVLTKTKLNRHLDVFTQLHFWLLTQEHDWLKSNLIFVSPEKKSNAQKADLIFIFGFQSFAFKSKVLNLKKYFMDFLFKFSWDPSICIVLNRCLVTRSCECSLL